jgi:hypothetical protein
MKPIHGKSDTPLYKIWTGLKTNCDNPNGLGYKYRSSYPEKWKTFQGFYEDVGDFYIKGARLHKKIKGIPISKENYSWVTPAVKSPVDTFYTIWISMRRRCNEPNSASYKYYGGKGISVSDAWCHFHNFKADMWSTYTLGASLDRIDNSLGYFAKNCRWVTLIEQKRNTSTTKLRKEDIPTIRERYANGECCEAIAKDYNCHRKSINNVILGVTWKDV